MPFIKQVAIFARKSVPAPPPPIPAPSSMVSAGGDHSSYLTPTGRAWAWGGNSSGQIGDNSITSRCSPVSVRGTTRTFIKISAGFTFTTAIDKNGRAWAWGLNNVGQLGDNSTLDKCTPVSVAGSVKTFYEISSYSHTLAIDGTGQVWAWGSNSAGQLGDNTILSKRTPVSILGARKTFCKISTGESHSVGLDRNGAVWCWGNNGSGRLGNNDATQVSRLTPVAICGTTKTFCQIYAGGTTSYGIDKNGRLWGWGTNSSGQIGNNSTGFALTPVSILGTVKTFCKISAGTSYALALDKNGRAWGWGFNGGGNIGDNSATQRNTPVSVRGAIKTFCDISAGINGSAPHSLAIDRSGGIWAWGSATAGVLGNNKLILSRNTPVSVLGTAKTFCRVSGGSINGVVIDKNGRVWNWGSGGIGQLGNNDLINQYTPVSICGAVKTFCTIDFGSNFTIAIDKNGRAWGWGGNGSGVLGDNSITSKITPVSVAGAVKTFCKISANTHTMALDRYGRAWGWGNNFTGQLGDFSNTSRLTPVSVAGAAKTFCEIAAGNGHTLGIDRYGKLWTWGFNGNGQLGDNTISSQRTPIAVGGTNKTFCKISGGLNYSVALDRYGRAWGWGVNNSGQIGNNSQISQRTPVSVQGAPKTFCSILAGERHTIAIDKNGRLWAWGRGDGGDLGIGSNPTACLTPVSVAGVVKTFCHIGLGQGQMSFAIDKNGRAWGWGTNSFGALGIDAGTVIYTPVRVCSI